MHYRQGCLFYSLVCLLLKRGAKQDVVDEDGQVRHEEAYQHRDIHTDMMACSPATVMTNKHTYIHFFVPTYIQEPLRLRFDTAMTMLQCYNAISGHCLYVTSSSSWYTPEREASVC